MAKRAASSNAKRTVAAKKGSAKKRSTSKRELLDPGTDKRYVKRTTTGKFKESDDVSRSLSADKRRKAKTTAKSGYGDQGDRSTKK